MSTKSFFAPPLLLVLLVVTIITSPASGQTSGKLTVGQRILILNPDGKKMPGTIKALNSSTKSAKVQILYRGKYQTEWVKFDKLFDTKGRPINAAPFAIGAAVEVLEKGEWAPATVEEVRGPKVKVRLDSNKMVRVVTAKSIRAIESDTHDPPPDVQPKDTEPAVDPNEVGGVDDPDDLFDPETGKWRVGGIIHPLDIEELHVGMPVFVHRSDEWTKAKIVSITDTNCQVQGQQGRNRFNVSAPLHKISLTEPVTLFSTIEFVETKSKRIIDASMEIVEAALPRLTPPGDPDAYISAPTEVGKHLLDNSKTHRHRIILTPVCPDHIGIATNYVLIQKYTEGGRLKIVDRRTGRTTFNGDVPEGWMPVSINASGTKVAMVTTEDFEANKLLLFDVTNPKQPKLSGIATEEPKLMRRSRQPGVREPIFISENRILMPDSAGKEVRLIDTSTNSVEWVLKGILNGMAIRPDGRLLAVGSQKGVTFVELPSGRILCHADIPGVRPACFSLDGLQLGLTSDEGMRIYEPETGQVVRQAFMRMSKATAFIDDYVIDDHRMAYHMDHQPCVVEYTSPTYKFAYTHRQGMTLALSGSTATIVPFPLQFEDYDHVINNPDEVAKTLLISEGSRVHLDIREGGEEARGAAGRRTRMGHR